MKTVPARTLPRRLILRSIPASLALMLPFRMAHAKALHTLKPLALPSPNTAIDDGTGAMVRLADYAPTPLVVNFWASWCPPCVHELPALQGLDRAIRQQGMAVALVGVDRKGRDFASGFLADRGIDIPYSLYDPRGKLARELGVRVMPNTFLIGSDGGVRGLIEGPEQWDDPAVTGRVIELLS